MNTVRFEIEDLVDVGRVLGRLSQIDLFKLADMASEYMVNSAKARITEEQASPEGDPWDPWSPAYAATRHGNHSLLVGGGSEDLRGSIANYASGLTAMAGSNLPYAAVHQFGSSDGGGIPARPYLGLGPRDREEIERMALNLFGEALR